MRVVSLLPSATELVCLVGGASFLVGRSHECDAPAEITDRPVLTGAKNAFTGMQAMNDAVTATLSSGDGLYWLDAELLRQLRPDVIVTQSLCSVCSVDLRLVERVVAEIAAAPATPGAELVPAPRVVSLNPFTIQDVLHDALVVGEALGLQEQARAAVDALQARIDAAVAFVTKQPRLQQKPVVAFCEWWEPIFPGGHWTPQLIAMAGGSHPLNPPLTEGGGAGPSLAVYNDQLAALDPDWIVLCACGLDMEESLRQLPSLTTRAFWPRLKAVQQGRVALVDGNLMFNRPGPRLVDCLEFLVGLLHGSQHKIPAGFPWRLLARDELADAEAAWLAANPGWATRPQQGPPPREGAAEAGKGAAGGCCAGGACCPAATS